MPGDKGVVAESRMQHEAPASQPLTRAGWGPQAIPYFRDLETEPQVTHQVRPGPLPSVPKTRDAMERPRALRRPGSSFRPRCPGRTGPAAGHPSHSRTEPDRAGGGRATPPGQVHDGGCFAAPFEGAGSAWDVPRLLGCAQLGKTRSALAGPGLRLGAPPGARVGRSAAIRRSPRPPAGRRERREPAERREPPRGEPGPRARGRADGLRGVLPPQLTDSEPVRPAAPGPAPRARPRLLVPRSFLGTARRPARWDELGGPPQAARRAVGTHGQSRARSRRHVAGWRPGNPPRPEMVSPNNGSGGAAGNSPSADGQVVSAAAQPRQGARIIAAPRPRRLTFHSPRK